MDTHSRLRDEWLVAGKSYPFVDWDKVIDWVEKTTETELRNHAYDQFARDWLNRLARAFAGNSTVAESTNFLLLTPKRNADAQKCLVQLEAYRSQIMQALKGLDFECQQSRAPVVITPDADSFVRYLSDYYENGEFMTPGGVCLRRGCIHFVLPDDNLTASAPILAHELTHYCLTGISWPLWLEEGVVQSVENLVTRQLPYILDREMVGRHQNYWNREKIRDFWVGRSFSFPDEGSELSYHLSRFLLEAAGQCGRDTLFAFLNKAHYRDAGFEAMQSALGFSPDEILADLLGDGDWSLGDLIGEQIEADQSEKMRISV